MIYTVVLNNQKVCHSFILLYNYFNQKYILKNYSQIVFDFFILYIFMHSLILHIHIYDVKRVVKSNVLIFNSLYISPN